MLARLLATSRPHPASLAFTWGIPTRLLEGTVSESLDSKNHCATKHIGKQHIRGTRYQIRRMDKTCP